MFLFSRWEGMVGNVLFGRMIRIILDSLTFDSYENRCQLGDSLADRSLLWKF